MVGYTVAPNSPYLKRGLLPAWAKLTLVVRAEHIQTPNEAKDVQAGDYVYLLAPPEKAQALDRFFVDLPPPRAPDPRLLGDFFVPGTATLGALADIYGLQISDEHMDITLAAQFADELKRPAKQGDIIHVGPIALLAHKVSKGTVTTVGLQLAAPDEPPSPLAGADRAGTNKATALSAGLGGAAGEPGRELNQRRAAEQHGRPEQIADHGLRQERQRRRIAGGEPGRGERIHAAEGPDREVGDDEEQQRIGDDRRHEHARRAHAIGHEGHKGRQDEHGVDRQRQRSSLAGR